MPKYNIYKINKEAEIELKEKMHSVGLSLVGEKQVEDFELRFYLSVEPRGVPVSWAELYRDFIPRELVPKNLTHFGVFIISNPHVCYAVSMGKAHFYLKRFCDSNFGIDLAERIADEGSLKMKNSKLFGGKKNKAIIAYQEKSALEFESGESIQFVKSKTIDPETWGETASFGTSTQLSLELGPDELPYLIKKIESELAVDARIHIPRATVVKDPARQAELDDRLARAIMHDDGNSSIQPAEPTVSGVDFIFLNKNNYRFIFEGRGEPVDGELSIEALREFVNRRGIDLPNDISRLKVKVCDEHGAGFTENVKYFLDYVDDDRYFLLDGGWHEFNQDYIDFLKSQVDERIIMEVSGVDFSPSGYAAWRATLPEDGTGQVSYAEAFFNSEREGEGYLNFDRDISVLQGLQIEKLDLWKDDTAFFVKIGTAQKMGYAVDQSMATIRTIQHHATPIQIQGQEIRPKKICLWFILDRKTRISKLSEIKSLILLMKLAEWQRLCSNAGFVAVVRVGYKAD